MLTEDWNLLLAGSAAVIAAGLIVRASRRQPTTFLQRMASMFDQPGAAFLAIDPVTGEIREATPNIVNLLPHAEHSTVSSLLAGFADDCAEPFRKLLKAAADGAHVAPLMLRTKDQTIIEAATLPPSGTGFALLVMKDISSQFRQAQLIENENEALKTDVRRYSLILNSAEEMVWLRNESLAIVYCNLVYTQVVDDASESSGGIPELHTQGRRLAEAALKSGTPQREKRHLVVGGQRRLFKIREVPMPDGGGVIGFARDITEVEEAQQEVDRHISAQADLLESSTSAMAIFGRDTRLRFYNHAYVALWKFDEIWLDGKPTYGEVLEVLREKRRLPEQANFKAFKEQRMRMFTDLLEPSEEFFYLPDGKTIRAVAIPHAMGGLMFAFEDVTDRLALERSYNTLIGVQKETLENLHEGVAVFGENGRIRLFNPVFAHLWQLEMADLPDQIHLNEVLEKIRHLFRTGEEEWDLYKRGFVGRVQSRTLYTQRLERSDGSVLDMSVVPLPDGGTLLTFTDVTDSTLVERSLREKNEALQAADRLKTEFLANVSYELRSPLTSISGFSEMLRQDYFGDLTERQREYVEGIHESSQHLMHLINDILDLASIEAGYMTLDIKEVDVSHMLRSVLSLLNERMKRFSIRAVLDFPADIGLIKADETRLRQVLFHLLSNAVKYSPEDGTVTLGARHEEGRVHLWVSDQGAGIQEEEQNAVFDKFYRGSAGSSMSGTGLGLSMVKSFIELHGGKVMLDSAPGRGTTVTCVLPQPEAALQPASKEPRSDERQSLSA